MYIVGYVGNNSVSSYHLHASETQQLANASSICVELLGGSCQSLTDQLTRHPITQWTAKQKTRKLTFTVVMHCKSTVILTLNLFDLIFEPKYRTIVNITAFTRFEANNGPSLRCGTKTPTVLFQFFPTRTFCSVS